MNHGRYEDLLGKTVLVTGSQGFLGKALSREYAKQGANLILVDRTEEDRALTHELRKRGISVEFYQVNFESQESRSTFINKILNTTGCLDVLVNNAAYAPAIIARMSQPL